MHGLCLDLFLHRYNLERAILLGWPTTSSELEKHRESLEAYFKEHPPASLPQAAAMIEQLTGIKRSAKQVGVFLKKLGLKRLKTYAVPAKTDSEVQETFKKKNWSHA